MFNVEYRVEIATIFDVWSNNLFLGINDETAKKARVNIRVQHGGGYQNEFLFAERLPATMALWETLESKVKQEDDTQTAAGSSTPICIPIKTETPG
jgi:hypothetical protein